MVALWEEKFGEQDWYEYVKDESIMVQYCKSIVLQRASYADIHTIAFDVDESLRLSTQSRLV